MAPLLVLSGCSRLLRTEMTQGEQMLRGTAGLSYSESFLLFIIFKGPLLGLIIVFSPLLPT